MLFFPQLVVGVGLGTGAGAGLGAAPSQLPFCSSVPQAAMANLLAVISLALLDTSVTPVGVPVVGKITSGLL